jgi:hypothetical protein
MVRVNRVPHFLATALVLLLSPCLACNASPVRQGDSGIKGQVLRGPVAPGPPPKGSPGEEPFRATFHVLDTQDKEVARFQSDQDGRFQVLLDPGDHTIVPDESAPILFPSTQRKKVTVPEQGFAEIVLKFDTGIR